MMDRTQKKCILASLGVHSLLLLLLLVGPAFLRSKDPVDNSPILDFVAYKTVDSLMSGGGNPNAKPPPGEPNKLPTPQPRVDPAPPPRQESKPEVKQKPVEVEKEPPKEPASKPIVNPEALEPVEKKRALPDVSTKLVKRIDAQAESRKRAEQQAAKADAKRQAEARRRIAESLAQAADTLSGGLSSGTTIELKGPGGGGVPYANWLQAVKSRYARAWEIPASVTDEEATTTVSVTIARNGDVVNARIIKFSKNSEVDQSVQRTLDRVTWAAPLPEASKDTEREVTIKFNVRARRNLG